MNYQEKVAWLGRYQTALSCQRMLEEEITVLRSDAARVTACMSGGTYRRCAEKAGAAAGWLHGGPDGGDARHPDGEGQRRAAGAAAALPHGPKLCRDRRCDGRGAAPGLPAAPRGG